MRDEVITRWHVLMEAVNSGRVGYMGPAQQKPSPYELRVISEMYKSPVKTMRAVHLLKGYTPDFNVEKLAEFIGSADRLWPKIALDQELTFAVNDDWDTSLSTLQALRDADLLKLPYDDQVVEITPKNGATSRRFICLQVMTEEDNEQHRKTMLEGGLLKPDNVDYDVTGALVELMVHPETREPLVVLDPCFVFCRWDYSAEGFGMIYSCGLANMFNVTDNTNAACVETQKETATLIGNVLASLYLMMRTHGVERLEIAAPAKLNKARLSRKAVAIPTVTHVHLRHIFDKSGAKQYVFHGANGGASKVQTNPHRVDGRKRLKLVRGHIRNQRFGAGFANSRPIFIEPFFRNLEPGDVLRPGPHLRVGL